MNRSTYSMVCRRVQRMVRLPLVFCMGQRKRNDPRAMFCPWLSRLSVGVTKEKQKKNIPFRQLLIKMGTNVEYIENNVVIITIKSSVFMTIRLKNLIFLSIMAEYLSQVTLIL